MRYVSVLPRMHTLSTEGEGCHTIRAPMGGDRPKGIADDADAYGDFAEPAEPSTRERASSNANPVPHAGPEGGIASDSALFEGLLEENSHSTRGLDSRWLYQLDDQVFGPVRPKELLQMLYQGEIEETTPIAPEDGEFLPLRRVGVFRAHLPKVAAHRVELEAAKLRARSESRRRAFRNLSLVAAAFGLLALGSVVTVWLVRSAREAEAERERAEKEAALQKELDALLASVTIEPPLLPLVDGDEDVSGSTRRARSRSRRSRRAKNRAVARFSGGRSRTGELTRTEIMSGVARAFPGFKRCIVKQIQRDAASVSPQIVLTFSVDNAGRAQQVGLTDRFLRRSPLKDCLAKQLGKVRWRAYKGEVRNIEYPITVGRQ